MRGSVRILIVMLVVAAGASAAPPAQAATFTVTKTADTADGSCDADCSLREAIIAANGAGSASTIALPAGTYLLDRTGRAEELAATGDLDISGTVTISGAGANSTTVNGNATDRIFEVDTSGDLTLQDLRLSNGAAIFADTIIGGGILSYGQLSLRDVIVKANQAEQGGGLDVSGDTMIARTLFLDNVATTIGVTNPFGGGIYLNGGSMTISSSSFVGNEADAGGGAVATNDGTLDVHDSTFHGNEASGGSALDLANTPTSIEGVTIANNVATGFSAVRRYDCCAGSPLHIRSTIVSNNTNGNCFDSSAISDGHNIEDQDSCGFAAPSDQPSTDPQLGAIGDHGGPTDTLPLSKTSPAVDSGGACTGQDQRGVPRPVGSGCDVGAYELAMCQAGVVNVVGTSHGDMLRGTSDANVILGLGGDDTLLGLGGNDRLCGGTGDDVIKAGPGTDRLVGDKGVDGCIGGTGRDRAVTCEKLKSIP